MTYRYAFVKWLGSASLVATLAGCPGGDDGDTGAETGPQPPTTEVATDDTTTTGAETTTAQDTTTTGAETTDPDTTTGGPVTCDPPCGVGQECVDGECVDVGDDTTGDPPMECGLGVQLNFPNPECGPCAEDACCAELQGCFGDETIMKETPCLQLNNCIAMECQMAMTLEELQACIDESCTENAGELNTWLAYQSCVGMNCMAECS